MKPSRQGDKGKERDNERQVIAKLGIKRQEDLPEFDKQAEGWVDAGIKCEDKKEYAQARAFYEKAADKGNAIAQYKLGSMYANGD